uniref:Uncharacterized protein n=1 Tax=Avena sativa TaxID=4498 RepID=A0ACD5UTI1_AVESA
MSAMDELRREEHRIAGHPYASEVGSVFLRGYYSVLASTPELARQFYTEGSTVVRLDCETLESAFGETVEEINEILMYMNVHKVEVKTANFLESWGGAIFGLVTGLVQLKGHPSRKRFSQSFILAPQVEPNGYFVFSDIFKFICDEYDAHYQIADYGVANNMPEMAAPNTLTETGIAPDSVQASDYVAEEFEANGFAAPADVEEREGGIIYENHEMQQQDPLEFEAGINEETYIEYPTPSFPSSEDIKQDASLAPLQPPSPPTPEEPVGEPPKLTYASVLRTKAPAGHQVTHSAPVNKATVGTAESQPVRQAAQERSNLDTRRVASVHEDEEFLSVYIGNLSPATSVFDLEKVFQAFGRIKPDGVAIRSRKEAGVFFGFVEYENMSGIQNALHASPIELNGRQVFVEERRPNSIIFRGGGRRGRGRADFSQGQYGGQYDTDYATRSKGNGYQRRGGRQYDGYE